MLFHKIIDASSASAMLMVEGHFLVKTPHMITVALIVVSLFGVRIYR